MKPFKRTLLITAAIIIFIFTTMVLLIFANSGYKLTAEPSIEVYDLIIDARVSGQPIELKEDEFNSIISMMIRDRITSGRITIYGVEAKLKSPGVTFYIPGKFMGFKVLLSTSGSLLDDGDNIVYRPSDIKAGRLRLPVGLIMSKAKDINISLLKINDDSISVSKASLAPDMDSFKIADNCVVLKFKGLQALQKESPSDNTADSGSSSASNSNTNTSAKPKSNTKPANKGGILENQNQESLKKLSSQLSSAIKIVVGEKEREILCRIKYSVDKKIANSSYNIYGDAAEVEASYNALALEEKNHIKSAILSAVDIQNAMELKKIFGL